MQLTTEQVLVILIENSISNSKQMLLRWAREGKLKGEYISRKEGLRFESEDVEKFIKSRKGIDVAVVPLEEKKVIESSEELLNEHKKKIKQLTKQNKEFLKVNEDLRNQLKEIGLNEDTNKSPKHQSYELSITNKEFLVFSDEQREEMINKKVQEFLLKEPFEKITKKAYEKLVYSLAGLWADSKELDKKVKFLEEQNKELAFIALEQRVTKEERMVLKGLGVSLADIIKNLPNKEDVVRKIEVLDTRYNVISIKFEYKTNYYVGVIKNRNYFREKILDNWGLTDVKNTKSKRSMQEKSIDKIEHDVIRKTFEELYRLETEHGKSFFLIV